MASWGRTDALPESLEKDTAKIAKVQQDLFGSFPFDRYVFISHIAPGASGGTEHLNSTVIQFKPTVATEAKDYRSLLALVSHELFHTWNVKQFRPAGIKPYDYLRENYTPLLWIAEGTTSYYDELTCVRAGVWEVKHYLESLGKVADAELRRPGGRVQSLESSSFDSWIKFNRPSPDSVNSTVSFYSKGALVSLMLDARMRETTGGARTLDDLMRALYKRFPLSGPGYTSDDVLALLTELTGEDFEPFFARYVRGTEPLALEEALAWFGLETHRDAGEEKGDGPRAYLGLDLKDDGGLAALTAVREDGPAHGAGVLPDDQIVAMDGLRLRAGDLDARLKGRTPGESVELTLLRRDQLRTVRLSLGESPRGALKVRRVEKATERQRAQYESWLGQPWPGKDGATDGSQAGGKEGAKDARP
jgi:predicted metalloprotease with PDZ domain